MTRRNCLLEFASEILLLVNAQTLKIAEVNPAAERLLGYSRRDLIGRPITEFECALADVFFWEDVRQGGAADVEDVEGSYLCASGEVLTASKSVFRVAGEPGWIVVRAVPDALRRRAEDELAYVTSSLRATLEASADGILLIDRADVTMNMNRRFAEMWKIPDAILAANSVDVLLRHMAAQFESPQPFLDKSRRLRPDTDDETFATLRLADGRVFECKSRPARQGDQIIGRVYTYTDVSERHRIEQEVIAARDEAKAASRAKGEFLAMMSHEIRTPMNGIIGTAQLLALTALDGEQTEYVRTIRASGESLLAIINDILDYSKIEAGALKLENTVFSLDEMLRDIEQLFFARVRESGVTLRCGRDGEIPATLLGDPTRLRQILVNLVGNAFKFTTAGSIEIAVGVAGRQENEISLRFSVRDTGIGIAADKLDKIFSPFEQADRSTTRRYGGTGLGLSICRLLTSLMGGEVGVASEEGRGSEFWFTVRLGVGVAAETVTQAPAKVRQPMLSPETRILLAEDNKVNQALLVRMLQKLGAGGIVVAANGLEALRICEEGHFDLIFMDARMPEMDGLEATCALRKSGVTTRIVGCSADAMEDDRQAALAAGMDDYLTKPVTLAALQAAIGRWREDRPE